MHLPNLSAPTYCVYWNARPLQYTSAIVFRCRFSRTALTGQLISIKILESMKTDLVVSAENFGWVCNSNFGYDDINVK